MSEQRQAQVVGVLLTQGANGRAVKLKSLADVVGQLVEKLPCLQGEALGHVADWLETSKGITSYLLKPGGGSYADAVTDSTVVRPASSATPTPPSEEFSRGRSLGSPGWNAEFSSRQTPAQALKNKPIPPSTALRGNAGLVTRLRELAGAADSAKAAACRAPYGWLMKFAVCESDAAALLKTHSVSWMGSEVVALRLAKSVAQCQDANEQVKSSFPWPMKGTRKITLEPWLPHLPLLLEHFDYLIAGDDGHSKGEAYRQLSLAWGVGESQIKQKCLEAMRLRKAGKLPDQQAA